MAYYANENPYVIQGHIATNILMLADFNALFDKLAETGL